VVTVQHFPNGVEVARVHGRVDQDVQDDDVQVRKGQPGIVPPLFRMLGWIAQAAGGDDLVGGADGRALRREHPFGCFARSDQPVTVVALGPEVQGLAGHHNLSVPKSCCPHSETKVTG
jgi:hypothetical protein